MNMKSVFSAVAMVLTLGASFASAYGPDYGPGRGGPGYGPGRGPDYGPGRGPGRGPGYPPPRRPEPPRRPNPPPPPPPPRYEDLCQGRYVGYYSNGFQATIDFNRGYGDSINVYVVLQGNPMSGTGYCRQYGDRADWQFTTMGVLNQGTIYRGHMSGGQPGGSSLSADKQY